ncbi:pleckstrin homology domain-containing family A member 1 [Ceratobasidium sp. AG-Ba]|nr:pleckstrin homology domain-containing family A member 1 [Ceratobasidium sp. AG-Ba]
MEPVAPPTPQEIQRKLSMHSPTAPVPISKRNSMRQTAPLSGTESDSDAGGAVGSSFSPSIASQAIPSEFSTSLQPLSVITEKRNPSGEETDEDEDEDDEAAHSRRGPAEKEVKDETVLKSGFLWKKGERRKTWKKRWFVLRTAKLGLYKNEQEYKLLRLVDLNDVHSVAPCELKKHTNTLAIVTPARTFYLQAETPADCEGWVRALNEARLQLKGEAVETSVPQAAPPSVTIPSAPLPSGQTPPAASAMTYATPSSPLQHTMSSSDSEGEGDLDGVNPVPIDPKQIVLQGYLMKCGTHMKSWRKRYFILTPETLKYGKSHMSMKNMRSVQVTQILDAIETASKGGGPSISPPTNTGDKEHIFKIITPKRAFLLCAPSEEEEIKWLSAVRALIARRAAGVPATVPADEASARARSKSISTRSIGEMVGSPIATTSAPVPAR